MRDPIDGVDAAQELVPIPNLALFQSDVSRAVGELLMPRHDGIEIEAIEDLTEKGAGYLAIWVDRSERRPHRSEAKGDKNYFKRIGTSSYPMEHYDIEDAFNRVAPTELKLVFDGVRNEGSFGSGAQAIHTYALKFSLRNDDRRSACAPYVWVENVFKNNGTVQRTITGEHSTSTLAEFDYGSKQFFEGGRVVYVHPGVAVPAFELKLEFMRHGGLPIINGRRAHENAVAFEYGFGCENARMTTGRFEIGGAKLDDFLAEVRPANFIEENQPQDH